MKTVESAGVEEEVGGKKLAVAIARVKEGALELLMLSLPLQLSSC